MSIKENMRVINKERGILLEKYKLERDRDIPPSPCSYCIVYKNSEEIEQHKRYFIDRGCFGHLLINTNEDSDKCVSYYSKVGDIVGFISLVIPPRKPDDHYKPQRTLTNKNRDSWLGWVLKKSPWQEVFHTKLSSVAIEKGIICRVNVPSNMLIAGLMVVRTITENTAKIIVWNELVGYGIDPTYAYLASFFFEPNKASTPDGYPLKYRGHFYPSAEHMAVGCDFFRDTNLIHNFLNGAIKKPRPLFKDNTIFTVNRATSIHYMWGMGDYRKSFSFAIPKVEGNSVKRGWMIDRGSNSAFEVGNKGNVFRTKEEKEMLVESITKQLDKIEEM